MAVVLVVATTAERVTALLAQLLGLAVLAGTIALVAAFVYRWYVREPIPWGLALLVGLGGVAAYLNTTTILGEVIGGVDDATREALFNIGAFAAGAGGARMGRTVGDGFGANVVRATRTGGFEGGLGTLVGAVGRAVTVDVPQEIDDAVGYDPVPSETKEAIAGRTFVFPRRLDGAELRERLVTRLQTEFAVGHVDVDIGPEGTVDYLALGSRAAGIGPTLPPGTTVVAIRADPAHAAGAGDLVQIWETGPAQRIATAEIRGVAGDVVTVAVDAGDTRKFDPKERYRLVTLPVQDRPDREFAALLRAADETVSTVTVEPDSPLAGGVVGALDVAVIRVTPEGGEPTVLPGDDYALEPGDAVYAIARPEALRRLEAAARSRGDATPAPVGDGESAGAGTVDGDATPAGGAVTDDGGDASEPARDDRPDE